MRYTSVHMDAESRFLFGREEDVFNGQFPSLDIAVAKVLDIRSGGLRWTPHRLSKPATGRQLGSFLAKFIEVREAGDEAILQLAREYGPLGLCAKHGAGIGHSPVWKVRYQEDGTAVRTALHAPALERVPRLGEVCAPQREGLQIYADPTEQLETYSEPLDGWRHYAKCAFWLLLVEGQIRRKEPVNREAWRNLMGEEWTREGEPILRQAAFEQWSRLHSDLRPFMAIPAAGQPPRPLYVSFTATELPDEKGRLGPCWGFRGGLFGLLATHLMLAATGGASLYQCANPDCNVPFFDKLVVGALGGRYCPVCKRNGAKQRLFNRRRRHAHPRLHSIENTPELKTP